MSGDALEMLGTIVEEHRGGHYVVECRIGEQQRRVLARASGRLIVHHIRLVVGDLVTLEVSPYDLARGRITFRGERRERTA